MSADPFITYTAERPRYFERQVLRAEDLGLEQAEVDRRRRQLTRFLHGWGIVAGFCLDTAAGSTDPTRPPSEDLTPTDLRVAAGFAVTPLGTELYLPEDVVLDDVLCRIPPECRPPGADCADTRPIEERVPDPAPPFAVFVIAEPASRGAVPLAARPEGCGHPGNHIAMSRTCDGIAIRLICGPLAPPHDAAPMACELNHDVVCAGEQMSEPEVPLPPLWGEAQEFVVLGALLVDDGGIVEVGAEARRRLLPVDILQRRLECLCQAPPPSPSPTSTPTLTLTSTFTFTPTLTFTFGPTVTFGPTLTIGPTATFEPSLTFTVAPTLGPTFVPPTFTVAPTFGPTLVPPGLAPGPGPIIVNPGLLDALDGELFDVERGRATGLDALAFLSEPERARLSAFGIGDAATLHAADTASLTDALGISEVRAAELKTEAAAAFRRADVPAGGELASGSVRELGGIGRRRGAVLEAAGFGTIGRLATMSAERLGEMLGVRTGIAEGMIAEARALTGRGER